eukprot:2635429-Pyramimonas_sp.AAC.1
MNACADCGVHQRRSADGAAVFDQGEYIDALGPIRHGDLVMAKADEQSRGQSCAINPAVVMVSLFGRCRA